jgi:hypothetical protein
MTEGAFAELGTYDPGPDPEELCSRSTVALADVRPEPIVWLWHGWLARGKVHVLDGDPNVGKSTLTVAIAAALSTGPASRFPDGARVEQPATSLISSAEDGLADTLRPRLDAAGGDPCRVFAFRLDAPLDALPAGLDVLEREILGRGADFVVIDPLMAHLESSVNSHRDQDVRIVLRELAAIAGRTRSAILLVRHLNKGSGSSPIYRGGGSIGIIGAARIGMLAAPDPEGAGFVLASSKNNLAAPPPSLAYKIVGVENGASRVEWAGVSRCSAAALLAVQGETDDGRSALGDAREFLSEILAERELPAKEVFSRGRAEGYAPITLRRAAKDLGVLKRKLGMGGGWAWSLEPECDQEIPKMLNTEKGSSSVVDDHLRGPGLPPLEGTWRAG